MSRGHTSGCEQYVEQLAESFTDFANRAGVATASLRKFRAGDKVIRRTTFNKIAKAFKEHYDVTIDPREHFNEVEETIRK